MMSENIELVDRDNRPVYKKQISRLGEKGERALQDSPGFEEEDEHPDLDPADAKIVSDNDKGS